MPAAPTIDEFVELLRRTTPEEYHQPIIDDPRGSFALYRAFCRGLALVSDRMNLAAQQAFYLPSSLQTGPPASSGSRATFEAEITRTVDLDQPRTVAAGRMEIQGPQGRRYRNTTETVWGPFDEEPTKTMVFEAVAIGFKYNLDHIADEDGNLTKPQVEPKVPWTDRIDLRPLSGDRTGTNASIERSASVNYPSVVSDSGRPDRFSEADIGLYLRIDNATEADNQGRVLRIVGFEDPREEIPADTGLYPRRVLVDDGPQRFRLTSAQADDGGAFTDETDEANSAAEGDMTLLPAAPAVNDAYYFGATVPFRELAITLDVAGEGDYTLTWEYWNGAAWTVVPSLIDGTLGFTTSGRVTLEAPGDWAASTVNSIGAYHIRARVSAFVSIATQPLGSQAYVGIQQQLADEDGTVTWSVVDWRDLGFEISAIQAATGGRDNVLKILGDERGLQQQPGESDDAFRRRAAKLPDMVSPNAINRAINRVLAEYGYWGRARDLGGPTTGPRAAYRGVFYDVATIAAPGFVSVYDMYEPGDVYPENGSMLQLSLEESRWFFFVEVPRLGLGDWGPFYDESPTISAGEGLGYIANAYDHAFYDGYPVTAYQIYARIYNTVDSIRMGGIGFTLLYADLPDCP
jgi:hypothetical protein